MTRQLLAPILLLLAACASTGSESGPFPAKLREQVLAERDLEASWDMEMFAEDLERRAPDREPRNYPMEYGVYPVPQYDRLGVGSFRGVGFTVLPGIGEFTTRVDGKDITGAGFYVHPNPWNAEAIGDGDALHYFQLMVLTDFIDDENFTHMRHQIVSRNHPDTIGQGSVPTSSSRVDYVAFTTAEGPSYAVVNMRLFDLSHGTTVLIAPQKDGSLRSLQLKTETPSADGEEWFAWARRVLARPDARAFFLSPGNI